MTLLEADLSAIENSKNGASMVQGEEMNIGVASQKQLFEAIHERYRDATTDQYAEAYKEEFVYGPILEHLEGARSMMEIASGVGTASGWMHAKMPELQISGCDISEVAASDFEALHGRPCYVWDLTTPIEPKETYDVVLVMGGIHHLVANLSQAFENIDRLLNPGGKLIMMEPNAEFLLEPLRRLWYRLDKQHFDAENEHALSHSKLVSGYAHSLFPSSLSYVGGPAYFLLLQNWVLRLPSGTKKWLAPAFMVIERLYHKLPGRYPFATFTACWTKRSGDK